MAKVNDNIVLHGLNGQIGKQLVVKQYAYGQVVSQFPNMQHIQPSHQQKEKRNKFGRAVAYAKSVLKDPALKAAFEQQLAPGQTVYHLALKTYLQSAAENL